MKCKKCGTEFNEGIFCPECGTKVEQEENGQEQQKQNQIMSEVDRKGKKKGKSDRKNNSISIISLICGIASWIGLFTVITPLVCGVIAIVCGIKSLKRKAKHRGCAVIGIVLAVLVYAFIIWAILQPSSNNTGTSDDSASTEIAETVMDESMEGTSANNEAVEQEEESKALVEEIPEDNEIEETEELVKDSRDNESDLNANSKLGRDVDFSSLTDEEKREWISTWMKTIENFEYQFDSDAKKLMPIYKEASEADESEFVYLKPEEKGLLNTTTYYTQTVGSSPLCYYGSLKDGKPNGKGVIFSFNEKKAPYLTIANFKKGFIDGYAIICDKLIVKSEGHYDNGVLNGEYVSYGKIESIDYNQFFVNEEYASDWYMSYEERYDKSIILDMPLSNEYIYNQGKYKKGKKTGIWKTYTYYYGDTTPDIILHSEIKYKNDKAIEGSYYYENENLKYKGSLSYDGRYDGKGILYNEDGSVKYKGKFKNGDVAE